MSYLDHCDYRCDSDEECIDGDERFNEVYGFPKENPFALCERLPEDSEHHYVPPVEDFWKIHAIADPDDQAMLIALLYTGAHRSESMRWTWEDDIDLRNRKIRLSTCKTADGSRKYDWLSMPGRLYEELVSLKLRSSGTGAMFRSKRTGKAYVNRKHFIRRLCERAGVTPFGYHGIRGLCATLLSSDGVPPKEIQTILMHSNLTTPTGTSRNSV